MTAARRSAAGTVLPALLQAADQALPAAVALRRELHASPELGGHETRTAGRVAAALGEPGAPPVTTGRLLRMGAANGPSVAIRAELDAMPMRPVSARRAATRPVRPGWLRMGRRQRPFGEGGPW